MFWRIESTCVWNMPGIFKCGGKRTLLDATVSMSGDNSLFGLRWVVKLSIPIAAGIVDIHKIEPIQRAVE
ncbi:hypothetical protein GJ496_004852 [Pomphorhynchus laevis]|nr:hypothetical protein GJ496_004852 [Pomphorhynchus laevis]